MRPLFTVPIGLALAILPARAQENPTPQITPPPAPILAPVPLESDSDEPETPLQTLLQRARQNNPRLEVARENLEAARGRAQSVRALPGPTLQIVPAIGGSNNARDEEIIVAQPLDLFGARRARAEVGAAGVRRVEAQNRLVARTIEVEVRSAAALLFAAQEAENLDQVQVEVAGLFRTAAARRAALGDVPPVQTQRAELELLRAQNDLALARAARSTRRAALNTLIGAPPNAPLRVALPLDPLAAALLRTRAGVAAPVVAAPVVAAPVVAAPVVAAPGVAAPGVAAPATSAQIGGELVSPDAATFAIRPDLAGAQATLEGSRAEVQALRRERLPRFELQVRHAPVLERDGAATALRAVFTVPLLDFGVFRGQNRAAQAEVRAQEAQIRLLNQQATAQVEIARAQIQSRRENARRYQTQILPLTLDLLRKTQIGYAQGASTYLEVLEAQRTFRQIQNEYLQALVGVQTGEIALDAALNGGTPNLENLLENSALRGDAR